MSGSESQFRSRLARVVRNELNGQFIPVATAETAGDSIPDVELCLPDGVQAWVELKVHDLSRKDPWSSPRKISHFTRGQAKWLQDRARMGGRAGLMIMLRWPDSKARSYVILPARTAGKLWIDQSKGNSWSFKDFQAASPMGDSSQGINADWLRESILALGDDIHLQ